jgi:hypothetical protein
MAPRGDATSRSRHLAWRAASIGISSGVATKRVSFLIKTHARNDTGYRKMHHSFGAPSAFVDRSWTPRAFGEQLRRAGSKVHGVRLLFAAFETGHLIDLDSNASRR